MEKQGKAQDCEVSIVILTKNEATNVGLCLDSIFAQEYQGEFEVLVIDSGSEDGTLEIVRGYPVTLVEIPREEFSHGGTRNLGASLGQGQYIVYITADAFAADAYWLRNLTARLDRPEVAGVYGRQIPKEDASPVERFMLGYLYGPQKRVQAWEEGEVVDIDLTWFSDVNSVVRKSVWQDYNFAEDLIMSEDQEWAKRVLLGGHLIVYEPEAAVFHSHNYSLGRLFRRNFDSAHSLRRITEDHVSNIIGHGLRYIAEEMVFLTCEGLWYMIPYALLYETCRAFGFLAGRYGHLLPLPLRKRLSLYRQYWNRIG